MGGGGRHHCQQTARGSFIWVGFMQRRLATPCSVTLPETTVKLYIATVECEQPIESGYLACRHNVFRTMSVELSY